MGSHVAGTPLWIGRGRCAAVVARYPTRAWEGAGVSLPKRESAAFSSDPNLLGASQYLATEMLVHRSDDPPLGIRKTQLSEAKRPHQISRLKEED